MNDTTSFIFVFGSNLAGRHGKGAALLAKQKYGAIYGNGIGRQGNSYAIPTKDENLNPLSLEVIESYIYNFLDYAWNTEGVFVVTPIGTGLAGHNVNEITSIFKKYEREKGMPHNIMFTWSWFK